MKHVAFIALTLALAGTAAAQSYRELVNSGNDAYNQKQYDAAAKKYDEASKKNPNRYESWYNRGNTAYKTDDVKKAVDSYKAAAMQALKSGSREDGARALYNIGDTFLNAAEKAGKNPAMQQAGGEQAQQARQEGYKQAIEAYKESLKLNPNDADTRYNLAYAMRQLALQQQQQNQKQNKDKKNDQKKDQQQKQDQNKNDQNKDKNDQQKQQQQQPQKQEKKMSKQQAEQILHALEREEKNLQKDKRAQKAVRGNVDKDW